MTDSGLEAIQAGLAGDPAIVAVVGSTNLQLNAALGPFFGPTFPDYDRSKLAKGVYHPAGTSAQNMLPNSANSVFAPNGLGNLAADAIRNAPNSIIVQTVAAGGSIPSGFDVTPFQAGIVATGVLRGTLQANAPISFADIYNILPLGISPDTKQSVPVGYPLISAYLDLADIQKLCALQLVVQANLAPSDYYLNLSGIRYGLKAAESYTYFKYATAASVIQVASQRANAGSAAAGQALVALSSLAKDGGAALLAAYGADNPFAGAMVQLNDVNPSSAQIFANLNVLGQVAGAGAVDAATGSATASALIVSKAVAAIDTVSAFATSDSMNTGPVTVLTGATRVRTAADLFAIAALGTIQTQFGTTITAYRASTGSASLSLADPVGLLANRINAAPLSGTIQELKEWMALLSYLGTGLSGSIPSAYSSTTDFTQFGNFGAAVRTRNASYPIASIGQLVGTVATLRGATRCATTAPLVSAVTNASYGSVLTPNGTIIVWGSGYSGAGGNSAVFNRVGSTDSISTNISSGGYFWDLSPNQLNLTLPSAIGSGQWTLSVKNACGTSSTAFPLTIGA